MPLCRMPLCLMPLCQMLLCQMLLSKCYCAKCYCAKCYCAICYCAKCYCAKCYCAECHCAECRCTVSLTLAKARVILKGWTCVDQQARRTTISQRGGGGGQGVILTHYTLPVTLIPQLTMLHSANLVACFDTGLHNPAEIGQSPPPKTRGRVSFVETVEKLRILEFQWDLWGQYYKAYYSCKMILVKTGINRDDTLCCCFIRFLMWCPSWVSCHFLSPRVRTEQKLVLSSSFRCGQIYKCQRYGFGHTFVLLKSHLDINKATSVRWTALGVTKFKKVKDMVLVTLCSST